MYAIFKINGSPRDPDHWSARWGPHSEKNSLTEAEIEIFHGIRGVSKFVGVKIVADTEEDASGLAISIGCVIAIRKNSSRRKKDLEDAEDL